MCCMFLFDLFCNREHFLVCWVMSSGFFVCCSWCSSLSWHLISWSISLFVCWSVWWVPLAFPTATFFFFEACFHFLFSFEISKCLLWAASTSGFTAGFDVGVTMLFCCSFLLGVCSFVFLMFPLAVISSTSKFAEALLKVVLFCFLCVCFSSVWFGLSVGSFHFHLCF